VAAISEIPAADPNTPALIESAEKVKSGSPAFATVTYHTARLLIGRGKTDEARAKLDAMLANRDELPRSTVNEFAALRMSVARNLDELLVDAPRTPLGITDDADSDELPSQLDDQGLKDLAAGSLFDTDGASTLTRGLPLSVPMQGARSQTLPSRLRGQVALTTFIRAILLGNLPAAKLAPLVMKSFPQLQPSIDAWLAAQDPDGQRSRSRPFDISRRFEMLNFSAISELPGAAGARPSRPDEISSDAPVFLSCLHRSARQY
jgi:hypothetical protein